MSFNLSPGEKVAIVGKSGAGKSTLIDLILGFYRPDQGKIEIGSVDISSILPMDLKSHIAFISQDVFLFDDTIEENIKDGFSAASKAKLRLDSAATCASATFNSLPRLVIFTLLSASRRL